MGKVIAFAGLSGSGKSTMARLLAQHFNAECLLEPEEIAWSPRIKDREKYGGSTAMLELRQLWASQFIEADCKRKQGKLVIIDTYFFKISGYYLDKPGMEWLVEPNDPYLPTLMHLHKLDQIHVPDADCVILFDVSLDDWKLLIKARGRQWDKSPGFAESYELNKRYIEEATIAHCTAHSLKLIKFIHTFGDPYAQALRLKDILKAQEREINNELR